MSASNQERQKKWLGKQAAEGKKRLTILVDRDAHERVLKEKRRTGETISSIVNRAIQQLAPKEEKRVEPAKSAHKTVNDNERSLKPHETTVNDNGKDFELGEEKVETSRVVDDAGSPRVLIKSEVAESVSDNDFSSLNRLENRDEKKLDDETHETGEESDKGIGQARSLIKRLLSLTKNS